ncbi:MAG: peptidase M23, partial [Bacteroidetes bacterium]|nr:peptidase M23 [Bacteroidota bacterium]
MRANKRKVFLLIAFSLTSLLPVTAQKNKSDLEKDKKENLLKIQEAEKILSQTEIKKKSTLGQLNAINRQIEI